MLPSAVRTRTLLPPVALSVKTTTPGSRGCVATPKGAHVLVVLAGPSPLKPPAPVPARGVTSSVEVLRSASLFAPDRAMTTELLPL